MMPLSISERDQLQATLQDAFRTMSHFDRLVARLGRLPAEYGQDNIVDRIAALISDYESRNDIESVLAAPLLLADWAQNTALKAALDNVRQSIQARQGPAWLAAPDPYQAHFLAQGRPFIGRDEFRKQVKDLTREQGKRFLVVNGPAAHGKTHSQYFIETLAPKAGFKFSYIELKEETVSKYHPAIMARRIDRDLALPTTDPLPEQQAVGDRWAQELCDWLVEKIILDGSRCWLVLDGFADPRLPDETKRLVNNLIDAVDTRLVKARLVLLDYQLQQLRSKLRPFVHKEFLDPLDQGRLEKFFDQVFTRAGIEHDPAQVTDLAAKILHNLPPLPQDDPAADANERMHERMDEIVARIMVTIETVLPPE
jgi:hypothetical protein